MFNNKTHKYFKKRSSQPSVVKMLNRTLICIKNYESSKQSAHLKRTSPADQFSVHFTDAAT